MGSREKEKRIEPLRSGEGNVHGAQTWLGSSDPDVQADPEEAIMPARVKCSRDRLAPSTYSKAILRVERAVAFVAVDGSSWECAAGRPGSSRSRRAFTRVFSSAIAHGGLAWTPSATRCARCSRCRRVGSALLVTAAQQRLEPRAALDVERADAL